MRKASTEMLEQGTQAPSPAPDLIPAENEQRNLTGNSHSDWYSKRGHLTAILQRCVTGVVEDWLARVTQSSELNHLILSDEERTGHLPKLVADLIARLGKSSATTKDSDALSSTAAIAHGKLRYLQGYTPAMLVHESRILQVTLFGALQSNLHFLDFSLLLPDVMTIADEVDAQLTQTMDSYMNVMRKVGAA